MGCEQSTPQQREAAGAAVVRAAKPAPKAWKTMKPEEILEAVRNDVIGQHLMITTPFGEKKMTYADYTASGRGLGFVEDFIRDEVLPYYANTHTEASITGRQTNIYREDARAIIKKSCNAGDEFACVFAGSGCTTAICTLAGMLGLTLSDDAGAAEMDELKRPLVVHGPMEHHSNILPWRESSAYTLECGLDKHGLLDLDDLEKILIEHKGRSRRIVSVSAASNVSGLVADRKAISAVCRKHGALVFFDYACGAPYLKIDASLGDAVFISPHKFIGGPGTPGVLLVRKSIVTSDRPYRPGGGTVEFVETRESRYTSNIEAREEGGTPEIVGAIRAGLCFKIKDMVTPELIGARENEFVQRAWKKWEGLPIEVMGGKEAARVSVITFMIGCGKTGLFMHYNYIVALLNDLYGIQVRGGCMCAGPYGVRLFGFEGEELEQHKALVYGDLGAATNVMKPGYIRLNLNWFLPDHEVDFILDAVAQVATKGWRMMAQYELCGRSGGWVKPSKCKDFRLEEKFGTGTAGPCRPMSAAEEKVLYAKYLAEASKALDEADINAPWTCPDFPLFEERWFPVPTDFTDAVAPSNRDKRVAKDAKTEMKATAGRGCAGHFRRGEYVDGEVPPSPCASSEGEEDAAVAGTA